MRIRNYLSKKRFSTVQVVGMLIVVFLGITVLAYAAVSIPHNFTPNTTAKASEVNANFQALADAINNRTSASLANMAGTWKYIRTGSFLEVLNSNTLCTTTVTGTLTLNADGTFSDVAATTNNYCNGNGVQTNTGRTSAGTWTVSADGSGTLTYSGGTMSFLTSKDINTMTTSWNLSTGNFPANGSGTYHRQ